MWNKIDIIFLYSLIQSIVYTHQYMVKPHYNHSLMCICLLSSIDNLCSHHSTQTLYIKMLLLRDLQYYYQNHIYYTNICEICQYILANLLTFLQKRKQGGSTALFLTVYYIPSAPPPTGRGRKYCGSRKLRPKGVWSLRRFPCLQPTVRCPGDCLRSRRKTWRLRFFHRWSRLQWLEHKLYCRYCKGTS